MLCTPEDTPLGSEAGGIFRLWAGWEAFGTLPQKYPGIVYQRRRVKLEFAGFCPFNELYRFWLFISFLPLILPWDGEMPMMGPGGLSPKLTENGK